MTIGEIRAQVARYLPGGYEDLNLTFYGEDCRELGDYIVIGNDYGTDLCVNRQNGAIYSIDPWKKLPTRFVNSGIPQLARFIEVSKSYSIANAEGPQILAKKMQVALEKIDSPAIADRDNWWAVILEQIAQG